ncbi:MAG: Gfo/Idh/MocA family oxidoreductase [Planctomycetota bacterium]|jgi:predicted dehydrogenase|nr:Gfo/Idh/MocA family oxidoreductase [Planctomycetota bacterium]
MAKQSKLRLGIVGIGNMGKSHIANIVNGSVPSVELTAICDSDAAALKAYPDYAHYDDSKKMIRSGEVDAILVATPHYDHTTIGIDGLKAGLHVLVEKPLAVHKADAERMIAAYNKRPNKKQQFGAMFNQRTDRRYQKIKELVESGEIGELQRVNWIITTWYRTQTYYNSGGWRATWAGEGGGVLLNQCPHQLDLIQWLCGKPSKVNATIGIGKYHDIEVEDEVTAFLEYPNGATGVFITSTGEAPGTNRLEIVGTKGKLVADGPGLTFWRNRETTDKHLATSPNGFGTPECWKCDVPVGGGGGQHSEILENFAQACLGKAKLMAPAVEGINGVELACAMLYSGFTGKPVDLPMNGAVYERHLKKLIKDAAAKPKRRKAKAKTKKAASSDFDNSF